MPQKNGVCLKCPSAMALCWCHNKKCLMPYFNVASFCACLKFSMQVLRARH